MLYIYFTKLIDNLFYRVSQSLCLTALSLSLPIKTSLFFIGKELYLFHYRRSFYHYLWDNYRILLVYNIVFVIPYVNVEVDERGQHVGVYSTSNESLGGSFFYNFQDSSTVMGGTIDGDWPVLVGKHNIFIIEQFISSFVIGQDIFFFIFLLLFILIGTLVYGQLQTNLISKVLRSSCYGLVIYLVLYFLYSLYSFIKLSDSLVICWHNLMIYNPSIIFFKVIIIFLVIVYLWVVAPILTFHRVIRFEYIFFISLIIFGVLLLFSANNFIVVFVGLEILNLSLYVMAAIIKFSLRGLEAGTKYLILGSLATGFFLKGVSLFYYGTGMTSFLYLDIADLFLQNIVLFDGKVLIEGGILFLVVSFFFKLGVVPFHSWLLDVYAGAPLIITAFFATVIKLVIFLFFILIIYRLSWALVPGWDPLFLAFGAFTAFFGATGAFAQRRLQRFFAYSAINHTGFLIIFLAFFDKESISNIILYLLSYGFTMLVIFGLLLHITGTYYKVELVNGVIKKKKKGFFSIQHLSDLQQLVITHKSVALCLAILFFSLGGIPPLLGFFPKLALFDLLLESKLFFLLLFFLFLSVLSIGYYIRIIKILFFEPVNLVFATVLNYGRKGVVTDFLIRWHPIKSSLLFATWCFILFLFLAPFYIDSLLHYLYIISSNVINPYLAKDLYIF